MVPLLPEGLYQFDFFTFRAGLDGHADGPLMVPVAGCLAKHGGQHGHLGNYLEYYPESGPHVVQMADAAFVLGTEPDLSA